MSPFLELMLEYVKDNSSVMNSFDRHGRTPLQLAVWWRNATAAQILVCIVTKLVLEITTLMASHAFLPANP